MVHCSLNKMKLAFDVQYKIVVLTFFTYLVASVLVLKGTCLALALEMLALHPFLVCSRKRWCRLLVILGPLILGPVTFPAADRKVTGQSIKNLFGVLDDQLLAAEVSEELSGSKDKTQIGLFIECKSVFNNENTYICFWNWKSENTYTCFLFTVIFVNCLFTCLILWCFAILWSHHYSSYFGDVP